MSVDRSTVLGSMLGAMLAPLAKWLLKKGLVATVGTMFVLWVIFRNLDPLWQLLIAGVVVGAVVLTVGERVSTRPRWSRRSVVLDERPVREPIPQWLRQQIIERDRGICGICLFKVRPGEEHIDHITPVHAGGTNDPANLQCAHPECNLRKGGMVGWQPPYRRELR